MQKNAPSICRLHLNLSCKAHLAPRTEKNTKKRARLPRQTICHLPTRQKKNLSAPRQQASYSTRRSSPSPHDNKQSKEKAEAMPPFKLFSRHSATIGKKQKTDTLATTIKKNAPQQVTPPPDNKSRKRRNRTRSVQPLLCRPRRFFRPAPFQILCVARRFKSFAPLSPPLNTSPQSALKKRSTKNFIPRRKRRTLLTRNRPQTQTRNKKTRKKTSFTQNT